MAMTVTGVAARGGHGSSRGAGGASASEGDSAIMQMILLYVLGALTILLVTLCICRRYTQYGLPTACADRRAGRGCVCCRPHRVGVTETGAEISTGSDWGVVPGIDRNGGPS
jgi:hypothetical protein